MKIPKINSEIKVQPNGLIDDLLTSRAEKEIKEYNALVALVDKNSQDILKAYSQDILKKYGKDPFEQNSTKQVIAQPVKATTELKSNPPEVFNKTIAPKKLPPLPSEFKRLSGEVLSQKNEVLPEENKSHFTDSRSWRWTIGRISSALKIPFYFLGTIFQEGKVVGKSIAQKVITLVKDKKYLEETRFSTEKIDDDIDACETIIQDLQDSIMNTFIAPPKKYESLASSISTIFNAAIKSEYENRKQFD